MMALIGTHLCRSDAFETHTAHPKIAAVLASLGNNVALLLAQWDALVSVVEVAPPCAMRCRDPDVQM